MYDSEVNIDGDVIPVASEKKVVCSVLKLYKWAMSGFSDFTPNSSIFLNTTRCLLSVLNLISETL